VVHSHDNQGSQALDMVRNPDAGVDKQLPVVGELDSPGPAAAANESVPEVGDKARRRAGRVGHPRDRQEAHP
jgi:hypothetical protein